uniref:HNH nuclease domain-containing protein n=1 Tax=Arsenophonus endosymbiont of Trialeurodes vaporariorum TaxID=235567 RepID=A0A3B0LZ02_9GAMM
MLYQPLKRCTEPGCSTRVKSGKCEEHKIEARRRVDEQRGTRRERGYTPQWDKYRLIYLKAHPLCVMCESKGIYTPAKIVDHIIPIEGEVMYCSGGKITINHCVRDVITAKLFSKSYH